MKIFWLKITWLVVPVLIVGFVISLLQSSIDPKEYETSKMNHAEKNGKPKTTSKMESSVVQQMGNEPINLGKPIAKPKVPNPKAERLYQMALSQKESNNISAASYRMIDAGCTEILNKYPDSPEAEKAKELLTQVPEQYRQQNLNGPKVQKSKMLRQKMPYQERYKDDIDSIRIVDGAIRTTQ